MHELQHIYLEHLEMDGIADQYYRLENEAIEAMEDIEDE